MIRRGDGEGVRPMAGSGAVEARSAPVAEPAGVARLFLRQSGAAGSPLVLLHGLASSSRYWLPAAPALGRRHRLYIPDLLGFGRSPKPFAAGYTPAEHVSALEASLRVAAVAGPLALLGHSAGSLIALQYASARPEGVRGLVLMALPVIGCLPWGHRADGSAGRLHRFVAHTDRGARVATLAIRLAGPLGRRLAPRVQRDVPPDAARDALAVTAASYWRTLENVVYGMEAAALLDRIGAPTLLIHGEHDRTAPLEPVAALAATRPHLRLCVVPGAGHNPLISHERLVVEAIERFLDETA